MKHNYLNTENKLKFAAAMRDAIDAIKAGKPGALRVSISHGNVKMGEIPSISLMPGLTCPARCNETCGPDCYAAKIAMLRPSVLKAYARNTAIAYLYPDLYWQQINTTIATSRYFRFHVSGDIPDAVYFSRIIKTAKNNAHCQILVFTKQYELVNNWIAYNEQLPPDNLKILFSGWIDLKPVNPYGLPETNIFDESNPPSNNWLICGGNCSNCACKGVGCWQVQPGQTIAFKKH